MEKAISVIELYKKLDKLKDKFPNAKICLPDDEDGAARFLGNKIVWDDENIICFSEVKTEPQIETGKNFTGRTVSSKSECCKHINGKIVEKTIGKVFPEDASSTLYVVKLKGIREYMELYECEMV